MASTTTRAALVVQRYRDAYRVGNAIVAIGTTIKLIGLVLGAAIFLISLLGGAAIGQQSGSAALASLTTGAVVGGVVGLLFWLLGVLISSQGQVILASLDVAVNGSPFITDDDRAAAMSLPTEDPTREPAVAAAVGEVMTAPPASGAHRQPTIQSGERTITCPQCDTVNRASLYYCENCVRNLHI